MNRKLVGYYWLAAVTTYCLLLFSSQNILAQEDPGAIGSFTVLMDEYNYGDTAFTPSPPTTVQPVEVIASVHYPEDLSAGPFPLVIFMHGRHRTCYEGTSSFTQWPCTPPRQSIPSYQGYGYIAEILSSHGYIVVSISANGINAQDNGIVDDYGMLLRAQLIQYHLNLWETFNTTGGAPFGNTFIGAVDMNNIGTMGHSRGGEGVVRHYIYNNDEGSSYGIKAVLPIAPTDFSRNVINNVPLAVILPYCDGDVDDLQGVHYFDDALYNVPGDSAPKHTILVMGANHNFFNTTWTPSIFSAGSIDDWYRWADPEGIDPHCASASSQRLTDEEQRGVGLAYVTAFFRTYLGGETQFRSILAGNAPPPPSAMTDSDDIFISFHPPDDPRLRLDVNRLSGDANLTVNTLGDTVTASELDPYNLCGSESHCLSYAGADQQPHTKSSRLAPTVPGLSQLQLGWDNNTAIYRNSLPADSRDVSGFFALQFRAAVNFEDNRNPEVLPQNFSVTLTDGDENSATVNVNDVSNALYYPPGQTSGILPKVLLNTIHIPLSTFIGVGLTDIRSVQFNFDQEYQGALHITDIAFMNISSAVDVYMIVDLSGSFIDDLSNFKEQASGIIETLQSSFSDVQFGLAKFEDYPIHPFGQTDPARGDTAYTQLFDLTDNAELISSEIEGLPIPIGGDGDDWPQSQLTALYQAATGEGEDLSETGVGYPAASIPSGQEASFRDGATKLIILWTDAPFHNPGDPGDIPYPGPSFANTVNAILALDPPMVIGILSGNDANADADLKRIARATGAIVPSGGVDCDDDGQIDIPEGEELVCGIASSGVGVGDAVIGLVNAAAKEAASPIVAPIPENFDLYIFGDVSGIPHSGGSLAAGGNVNLDTFQLNNLVRDTVGLAAAGDLTLSGSGFVYGDVYYGGVGNIDSSVTISGDIYSNAQVIGLETQREELTARSAYTSRTPANGTAEIVDACWVQLTGTSTDLNVFTFPISPYDNFPCGINIDTPAGSAVVINVPGENPLLGHLAINANSANPEDILWNFHEASSVTLTNVLLPGTMLAPLADVVLTSCHVEGSIIAASLFSPDAHGEPKGASRFAHWDKLCPGWACYQSCDDGIQNQGETDIDCGGYFCPGSCEAGQTCLESPDCVGGLCEGGICQPTCTDNIMNQDETDVDCGGGCGATCQLGMTCVVNPDCDSNNCQAGICEEVAGGCIEATAIDLGSRGAVTTVPNDSCVMVKDGYPAWWTGPNLRIESTATCDGTVPFIWTNTCVGGSGSGGFDGPWQQWTLTPVSKDCATLIDLQGSGGSISLRWF